MYATYASNHENAAILASKLKERKNFASFLDVRLFNAFFSFQSNLFRKKNKQSLRNKKILRRLQLSDFLIMPVQRLPRYSLLLGQLQKVTPKGHLDYKLISKAINAIDEVSTHLDKSIKVANDASFIQKISVAMTDFPV